MEILVPHHLLQALLEHSLNEYNTKQVTEILGSTDSCREKIVSSSILLRVLLKETNSGDSNSFTLLEISRADASSLANIYLMKESIIAQNKRRKNKGNLN